MNADSCDMIRVADDGAAEAKEGQVVSVELESAMGRYSVLIVDLNQRVLNFPAITGCQPSPGGYSLPARMNSMRSP